MAKIVRKHQRIFAGDVPANNTVAEFGSLKAGTPTYSSDLDVIQSLSAWGAGWSGATINNSAPAMQDMNALFYVLSQQIAYLMQEGIAEYNVSTIYYTGSLVYDGTGIIFKCLADNTTGVALSDTSKWRVFKGDKKVDVSTNYTVLYDDCLVRATGSSSMTVTLPQAVSANSGREICIKSLLTGGAQVTISCSGGSLIDGQAEHLISQYSAMTVISNGTGYDIV